MDLIRFHRVLIAVAIIFCAGFSAWLLLAFARGGETWELLLGLGFAAAAGLLGVYLIHLRRVLRLPDPQRGSARGLRR